MSPMDVHTKPRRPRFTPAAAVMALTAASLVAQQPTTTFRSRVDTIEVQVTVRTSDGQIAGGLTKDDFELYDNGRRREITLFSAEIQPITIGLLLDRSGSIHNQATKVTDAAEAFVGRLLPDDRAAVDSLSYECQPLTADRAALVAMLRSPMQGDMGSPIWAGLDRTISSLTGEGGRRAILMFSDGIDSAPPPALSALMHLPPGPCHPWAHPSEATLADASKHAQREGVTVFTVSVEPATGTTNDDDLRSVARDSGGERYRLKQESELETAFTRIADELHHQYLLGFVPAVFDGKVHDLEVRVKRPGANVHARRSYVADRIDPATSRAPGPPAAPIPPLPPADVDLAIRNGSAGQKLQASCMASAVFRENPTETDAFVDVVVEGPVGRIMRRAREARQQHASFGAAQVTEDLRAPVVQVTAELKSTLRAGGGDPPADDASARAGAPPTKPPPELRGLSFLRLRSKAFVEAVLQPIAETAAGPDSGVRMVGAGPGSPGTIRKMGPVLRHVATFDLAAFRALPGADVEVVIRSSAGARYCTIGAKDKAAIR